MAKTKISSTDLIWMFHERLKAFDDCPAHGLSIAIVPAPDVGWMAVTNRTVRLRQPLWAKRIDAIQEQLRERYVLAKD